MDTSICQPVPDAHVRGMQAREHQAIAVMEWQRALNV